MLRIAETTHRDKVYVCYQNSGNGGHITAVFTEFTCSDQLIFRICGKNAGNTYHLSHLFLSLRIFSHYKSRRHWEWVEGLNFLFSWVRLCTWFCLSLLKQIKWYTPPNTVEQTVLYTTVVRLSRCWILWIDWAVVFQLPQSAGKHKIDHWH